MQAACPGLVLSLTRARKWSGCERGGPPCGRSWRIVSHSLNSNPYPGAFLNYRATLRLAEVTLDSSTFLECAAAPRQAPPLPPPGPGRPVVPVSSARTARMRRMRHVDVRRAWMRASSVVRRVLTSGRAGACQAPSRARRACRWESCFETEFPSADVMRAALRARCEGGIRGMATWLSLRGAPSAPPAWPGSNPSSPSKKRAPVIGAARPALARAPVAVTASAHVSGGGGGGGGGAPQALGAAGGAAPGVLVPAPCAPVPLQQTGAFVSAPGAGYPGMAVGLGFPGMVPGGSAPPQQLAAPPQQLAAGAVLQAGPPQQAGVLGQALAARSAHGSLELLAGAHSQFGGQSLLPASRGSRSLQAGVQAPFSGVSLAAMPRGSLPLQAGAQAPFPGVSLATMPQGSLPLQAGAQAPFQEGVSLAAMPRGSLPLTAAAAPSAALHPAEYPGAQALRAAVAALAAGAAPPPQELAERSSSSAPLGTARPAALGGLRRGHTDGAMECGGSRAGSPGARGGSLAHVGKLASC